MATVFRRLRERAETQNLRNCAIRPVDNIGDVIELPIRHPPDFQHVVMVELQTLYVLQHLLLKQTLIIGHCIS